MASSNELGGVWIHWAAAQRVPSGWGMLCAPWGSLPTDAGSWGRSEEELSLEGRARFDQEIQEGRCAKQRKTCAPDHPSCDGNLEETVRREQGALQGQKDKSLESPRGGARCRYAGDEWRRNGSVAQPI